MSIRLTVKGRRIGKIVGNTLTRLGFSQVELQYTGSQLYCFISVVSTHIPQSDTPTSGLYGEHQFTGQIAMVFERGVKKDPLSRPEQERGPSSGEPYLVSVVLGVVIIDAVDS